MRLGEDIFVGGWEPPPEVDIITPLNFGQILSRGLCKDGANISLTGCHYGRNRRAMRMLAVGSGAAVTAADESIGWAGGEYFDFRTPTGTGNVVTAQPDGKISSVTSHTTNLYAP